VLYHAGFDSFGVVKNGDNATYPFLGSRRQRMLCGLSVVPLSNKEKVTERKEENSEMMEERTENEKSNDSVMSVTIGQLSR